MKIEIDIPKEFEEHFMLDKFEDSLHRLSADANLIAGNYEQETAIMLIKAFKESKTAYDVDKVLEQLKGAIIPIIDLKMGVKINGIQQTDDAILYERALEIVKAGGVNE